MATDTTVAAGAPLRQPSLGPIGWARWIWRQLTSMRTALLLLLLLAVAAVPGSIWPQRSVDPALVSAYLRNNPDVGPWLDRFGMFDVFSSPWFASIYLLLMVSLIGCLIPRSRIHVSAIRAQPPAAPTRLDRLPAYVRVDVDDEDDERVAEVARSVLRGHRYRVRTEPSRRDFDVAAETGYLKETGNLIFHIALLAVIISVAVGHLWGWRGEVILPEGATFTSSAAQYDTLSPGPWVDENSLEPFALRLDEMTVSFETEAGGAQFGAPREFSAQVETADPLGTEPQAQRLAVNDPLHLSGVSVYLLGNGYAPVVTVRDDAGEVLFSDAVPFLPQDDNYTSTGAVKVSGAEPELGLYGAFMPTARFDDERGPTSDFPDLIDPQLAIGVFEGDLFPGGAPQSVYVLDTAGMEPVRDADGEATRLLLQPGQTIELPDGRGSVTLDGVVRWSGLVMRHDPGRLPVLISSIAVLAGLVMMLAVRRRRVFVRVGGSGPLGEGERSALTEHRHTGVEVAGLVKGSDPALQALIERIADQIRREVEERHR
ncbi:MAG: cytochrome c biogenesis protein ResB [Ornithinimicrobium sp.]